MRNLLNDKRIKSCEKVSALLDRMRPRKENPMAEYEWIRKFPAAATVCDEAGVILEMNDKAILTFEAEGGAVLIGKNILDCHPEPARTKLRDIMAARRTNVYTIEKKGVKKLVFQAPWTLKGQYRGFVELVLEIPFEMPHFVREG
jgi:hypothetical protein